MGPGQIHEGDGWISILCGFEPPTLTLFGHIIIFSQFHVKKNLEKFLSWWPKLSGTKKSAVKSLPEKFPGKIWYNFTFNDFSPFYFSYYISSTWSWKSWALFKIWLRLVKNKFEFEKQGVPHRHTNWKNVFSLSKFHSRIFWLISGLISWKNA